jgi:hemoglobin
MISTQFPTMQPPSPPPTTGTTRPRPYAGWRLSAHSLALLSAALLITGCGTSRPEDRQSDFFTSGSREADERATQRMSRNEQLSDTSRSEPGLDPESLPLFDRLGGEQGITAIVDDFIPRVLQDPRVNWERKGVTSGGLFQRKSVTWNSTNENVSRLKKHMIQFLCLVTGGPAQYDGRNIKSSHADMRITNAEFDATIGDLKVSLDLLQLRDREQRELLAIIESTRPQIVTER